MGSIHTKAGASGGDSAGGTARRRARERRDGSGGRRIRRPAVAGATAPLSPALAAGARREGGDALAAAGEREARGGRERLACGSAWKKSEKRGVTWL